MPAVRLGRQIVATVMLVSLHRSIEQEDKMGGITTYLEDAIDGGVNPKASQEFADYCGQLMDCPENIASRAILMELPKETRIEIGQLLADCQRAHTLANSLDYLVHRMIKKHTGLSTWDFRFVDHG